MWRGAATLSGPPPANSLQFCFDACPAPIATLLVTDLLLVLTRCMTPPNMSAHPATLNPCPHPLPQGNRITALEYTLCTWVRTGPGREALGVLADLFEWLAARPAWPPHPTAPRTSALLCPPSGDPRVDHHLHSRLLGVPLPPGPQVGGQRRPGRLLGMQPAAALSRPTHVRQRRQLKRCVAPRRARAWES